MFDSLIIGGLGGAGLRGTWRYRYGTSYWCSDVYSYIRRYQVDPRQRAS